MLWYNPYILKYGESIAMKRSTFIKFACLVIAVLILNGSSLGEAVVESPFSEHEWKQISCTYGDGSYCGDFMYSDELLFGDANQLSPDLAKASAALAGAAYSQQNATKALKEMGIEYESKNVQI